MLLPKKIRSLLNGGAAAAGPDGIQDAIAAIEAQTREHRAALADILTRRDAAALSDDPAKALTALKAEEEHRHNAIEAGEIQVAKLRISLREQVNLKRVDRINHHRRAVGEAFELLSDALVAACAAREAARTSYEAACRDLGAGDAQILVGNPDYPPPGVVVPEAVAFWSTATRNELAAARQRQPAVRTTAKNAPLPVESRSIIPHDANAVRRVALYQVPPPPDRPHTEPPSPMARPPVAKRAPRTLPEIPAAGKVRCVVVRAGYQDPDLTGADAWLVQGDTVDVDKDVARQAVSRGVLDYARVSK